MSVGVMTVASQWAPHRDQAAVLAGT